jgi:ribosomal-protein-alanine N-acetyltransferase
VHDSERTFDVKAGSAPYPVDVVSTAGPSITTDRLVLRRWRDADRDPFAALNADPDVMRYFLRPLDRDESDRLVDAVEARFETDGVGQWAVERRADGQFLGFTGLAPATFEASFTPAIEVGWRFARSAWGHGYATEAGRAALRYGFDVLSLDTILSWTAVLNLPSIAVMERLGMQRDPADDFDHPRIPPGHPLRRHVLYRLDRAEWLSRDPPDLATRGHPGRGWYPRQSPDQEIQAWLTAT